MQRRRRRGNHSMERRRRRGNHSMERRRRRGSNSLGWSAAARRATPGIGIARRRKPRRVARLKIIYGNRPPFQGLFDVNSASPGLRAALRRSTPGYGSFCASGAAFRVMAPSAPVALLSGLWLLLRLRRCIPGYGSLCASGAPGYGSLCASGAIKNIYTCASLACAFNGRAFEISRIKGAGHAAQGALRALGCHSSNHDA